MGYYEYYDDGEIQMDVHNFGNGPLKLTIQTSDPSESLLGRQFSGTGIDQGQAFTVVGTSEGPLVSFLKKHTLSSWGYKGIVLPWGLYGQWFRPHEAELALGEFYLWPKS